MELALIFLSSKHFDVVNLEHLTAFWMEVKTKCHIHLQVRSTMKQFSAPGLLLDIMITMSLTCTHMMTTVKKTRLLLFTHLEEVDLRSLAGTNLSLDGKA